MGNEPIILTEEEAELARRDSVIPAIKALRKRTGIGLIQAKDLVERHRGYRERACPRCGGRGRLKESTDTKPKEKRIARPPIEKLLQEHLIPSTASDFEHVDHEKRALHKKIMGLCWYVQQLEKDGKENRTSLRC